MSACGTAAPSAPAPLLRRKQDKNSPSRCTAVSLATRVRVLRLLNMSATVLLSRLFNATFADASPFSSAFGLTPSALFPATGISCAL